jgi:Kdo2-lipid IVA lauroyltransferase/acyltransferase
MTNRYQERLSKKIRYSLEWLVVYLAYGLFRLLGMKNASALGGAIAQFVGGLLPVNELARKNMKSALPDLSDDEININLKKMWNNLGRNFAELRYLNSLDIDGQILELEGEEYLKQFARHEKGPLVATAHFGQWELLPRIYKKAGLKATIIYRAANNPMVNSELQKHRLDPDLNFVPKGRQGARAMLSGLKKGHCVTLLNDQKLNNGVTIPFFGHDAMTATAVAEFALKLNIPIYPVRVERLGIQKFRIVISPPLQYVRTGDKSKDQRAVLVALNNEYEKWIRQRPDHWFWVHKRWPDIN